MRGRRLLALVAAVLIAPAAAPVTTAAAKPASAAQRDWTKMVAQTAEGGFRVGDPQAPISLIEYGSLTCSHCARFATEGMPALLRDHVRSGKVSFEFRNFVLNRYDLAAALLSRCAGPANYFAVTDAMFAAQPQWLARYAGVTSAEAAALQAVPESERPWRVATLGGLDALAAKGGVTAARAKACLADKAAIERLAELRRIGAEAHQVTATPTFIVNGVKADASDWATLEPLLRPPGG